MVPNVRFHELLADIEPSPTTKKNAAAAHTSLRAHLRSHKTFKTRWIADFLAGSYSRDVAIRPRTTEDGKERPDVDIVVETSFTTSDAPDDVLDEVADALGDEYEVERINKRSVRVATWNAEMDIVPVIKSGNAYLIPCREEKSWRWTNPPAHNTWATQQNNAFGGRAKPLAKMTKWWRRENPTSSRRPKGFVHEVLVALHAPRDEKHFGEAFASTLENIYSAYSFETSLGRKPVIADPAVYGNDIISRVTVPQWKEFIEKVRVYSGYARRAQEAEDIDEATGLWRRVFGARFRSTEAVAKAVTATFFSSAVAPARAYIFPNANATPTKPRGFA